MGGGKKKEREKKVFMSVCCVGKKGKKKKEGKKVEIAKCPLALWVMVIFSLKARWRKEKDNCLSLYFEGSAWDF